MGRYKRNTDRQSWSEISMTKAIEALRAKSMGLKKACKLFSVPRSTLQRRYKSSLASGAAATKRLGSRRNVFDAESEKNLFSI